LGLPDLPVLAEGDVDWALPEIEEIAAG